MRISDWSSDVCSSDLHVGVLFDRARFAKVGELWALVLAAFDLTAELRQRHNRNMKFLSQGLQTARNFRNLLHAIVAAFRRALKQLEIIDDDKADAVAPLEPARARAETRDRQAGRIVDEQRSEEHTSELQSLMRTSYA